MNTTTAIVETLTAEVRVLMVGKRQITLSVAKQLDHAPLPVMEPFGRVKITCGRFECGPHVIGRDQDGTLVLSQYEKYHGLPFVAGDYLSRKITVCREIFAPLTWGWQKKDSLTLMFRGRKIEAYQDALEPCPNEEHGRRSGEDRPRCQHWLTNNLDNEIQEVIDDHDKRVALHKNAAALPLIVLAGLK